MCVCYYTVKVDGIEMEKCNNSNFLYRRIMGWQSFYTQYNTNRNSDPSIENIRKNRVASCELQNIKGQISLRIRCSLLLRLDSSWFHIGNISLLHVRRSGIPNEDVQINMRSYIFQYSSTESYDSFNKIVQGRAFQTILKH